MLQHPSPQTPVKCKMNVTNNTASDPHQKSAPKLLAGRCSSKPGSQGPCPV